MSRYTSNVTSTLVYSYPEQSPFELDAPPYNLTPPSSKALTAVDTPEFLEAVLKQAQNTGFNPLATMYGTNPLYIADRRLLGAQLPPMAYKKPPPLEEIELPEDAEFVQQLNKGGNTVIVVTRVQDQLRLLKIVRLLYPFMSASGPTV